MRHIYQKGDLNLIFEPKSKRHKIYRKDKGYGFDYREKEIGSNTGWEVTCFEAFQDLIFYLSKYCHTKLILANNDYERTIENRFDPEKIYLNSENKLSITYAPGDLRKQISDEQIISWYNDLMRIDDSVNHSISEIIEIPIPILQDKTTDYVTDLCKRLQNKQDDEKFSVYLDIINKKPGLTDKDLVITDGYPKIKIAETDELIEIKHLSSGEKNILLLYYELVFNCEDNCLILIDEPETSLHVDWMKRIFDNISFICKTKDMQVIVSTHSPDVVGNHYELMEPMKR